MRLPPNRVLCASSTHLGNVHPGARLWRIVPCNLTRDPPCCVRCEALLQTGGRTALQVISYEANLLGFGVILLWLGRPKLLPCHVLLSGWTPPKRHTQPSWALQGLVECCGS